MYFTAAAFLALAASALAQVDGFDAITKPGQKETIPAGSTYEINWEPTDKYTGTVTLALLGGATPPTLQEIDTIAKSVDNSLGTYSWAVSSKLGSFATYGIRITLDSNSSIFQYSFPFAISGSSSSASGSATGSATSSSSSEPSTSSSSVDNVTSTSTTASLTTKVTSTSTPIGNLSTTATNLPGLTTITSTYNPTASTTGTKTSSPSTIPTGGASALAAGPVAMLGALAVAVLAL